MTTLSALLTEGAAALKEAGIEAPRVEARLLLEAATGLARTTVAAEPDRTVAPGTAANFRSLLARRMAREPMAYILGKAEFWSLPFAVGPGVLVPRADTETLIEVALRAFPDRSRPLRLLDIGTGSGCLALTLLHLFPNAIGIAADISRTALACTRRNAGRLGVASRLLPVAARFADAVRGPLDLVVSNPPYIPSSEIADLMPEVATFEPRLALDGGPDGLDAYRTILADLPRLLAPSGVALLEIGLGQEAALAPLAKGLGFSVTLHPDLAGITRCLELRPLPSA